MSVTAEDKKITVKEFKMWLAGVEEMQPEDWTPDGRQWQRIRDKIDTIEEAASGYQLPPVPGRQQQLPPGPMMQAPNFAPQYPAGSIPRAPVQQAPLAGPFGSDSGQIPVKTPNIDTQGKPYESSFA